MSDNVQPNEEVMILNTKIYPRSNDYQTVYLNAVVRNPAIVVGDYTIYNDFVNDPTQFEKNNVLYHYPVNGDRLVIGKFCSIACGAKFLFNSLQEAIQGCREELEFLIHCAERLEPPTEEDEDSKKRRLTHTGNAAFPH